VEVGDSAVSIVTKLRAEQPRNLDFTPHSVWSSLKRPDRTSTHPIYYSMCAGGCVFRRELVGAWIWP